MLVQRVSVVMMALMLVMVSCSPSTRLRRQHSGGRDAGYSGGGDDGEDSYSVQRTRDYKRCIDIHEVAHGQATCASSGCRLRCLPGYSFLGSESTARVMLTCDHTNGHLYFRGELWGPQKTVCAPLCSATCENGGTCVAPDTCACQSGYKGDTCQQERLLGDAPYGGYQLASLESNQRRIECPAGTQMPDGSTSVTVTYRDHSWFYPDGRLLLGVDLVTCNPVPLTAEPEKPYPTSASNKDDSRHPPGGRPNPLLSPTTVFVPYPSDTSTSSSFYTCSPPCTNGGECVLQNTCSCPRGYWGPHCQSRGCTFPRFENNLHASLGGTLKRLKFECHDGYQTRRRMGSVTVVCASSQWRLPGGKLLTEDDVRCVQ